MKTINTLIIISIFSQSAFLYAQNTFSNLVPDFSMNLDATEIIDGKQLYFDLLEYNQVSENVEQRFRGKYQLDSVELYEPHPNDPSVLYLWNKGYLYYNEDFTENNTLCFVFEPDGEERRPTITYQKRKVNQAKKITSISTHPWNGIDRPPLETELKSIVTFDYCSDSYLTKQSGFISNENFLSEKPSVVNEYIYNNDKLLDTIRTLKRDSLLDNLELTRQLTYHHNHEGLLTYILRYDVISNEVLDSTTFKYNNQNQITREELYSDSLKNIIEYSYDEDGRIYEILEPSISRPDLVFFETFFYNDFGSLDFVEKGRISNALELPDRVIATIASYDYKDDALIEDLSMTPDLIITARNDYDHHNHLLLEETNRNYDRDFLGGLIFRSHDLGTKWFYSPVVTSSERHLLDTETVVYPNPASTHLLVSLKDSQSKIMFSIYNSKGEKVGSSTYMSGGEINISSLSPGIYFYEIILDQKYSVGKFVKI